jgi:hypothetical protein
VVPEEGADGRAARHDPRDPRKVGEGLEEVPGEEVPREGAEEGVEEEALARDAAVGALAGEVLGVEGVEEGAGDEVRWPDWGGDR